MRIVDRNQYTVTIELARDDCRNLAAYCETAGGCEPHAGTVLPELYEAIFQLALETIEGAEYRDLHEGRHERQAS